MSADGLAGMQNPFFTYRARCVDVIDADTLDLTVDCGFGITHTIRVRLINIDTHEIYGVEKDSTEFQKGKEESIWVTKWLRDGRESYDGKWPLIASTVRDSTGKYGRYLADVYRQDTGASLTDAILQEFNGVSK